MGFTKVAQQPSGPARQLNRMSVRRRENLSQFEYVIIFVSILVALAVAELLAGLGRLIRERGRVRVYWVHIAWMLLSILAAAQSWWIVWHIKSQEFTNFAQFFLVIVPGLTFVLVAFLLAPPLTSGQSFDLRSYYFRHIRWIVFLFVGGLVGTAASRWAFGLESLLSPINLLRTVAAAILLSLGFAKSPRVHEATVPAICILVLLAITMNFRQPT